VDERALLPGAGALAVAFALFLVGSLIAENLHQDFWSPETGLDLPLVTIVCAAAVLIAWIPCAALLLAASGLVRCAAGLLRARPNRPSD
jgi:hypothetical protein